MIPLTLKTNNQTSTSPDWEQLRGVVPIYKPLNWTSHDVVGKLRRLTKEKRIGHGGTLDPLADGVLIIGIGRESTKKLASFASGEKTYQTVVRLGITSQTLDGEGPLTKSDIEKTPTQKEVDSVVKMFKGEILQTPPVYSALKISGVPAYKLARRGQAVELMPRTVNVSQIICDQYSYPDIRLTITCSGGTYIRSIARDIGEKLQTGAYMQALTRTAVGTYTLADCLLLPTNKNAGLCELQK